MKVSKQISASMESRLLRPFIQNHYSKTKCGKLISKYKNSFLGRRCFFIGNGPSLYADDLTVLYEHEEICFAFNRIYNIFNDTLWRPNFYISQDEKMLKGSEEEVNKLRSAIKFIPIQLKWYYDININDALYFNMNWKQKENYNDFIFSDNAAKELACASTGMYTAAQLAVYMGFSEIYLIGVDHHFQISQNNKGEIIVDKSVKDYFCEKYNEDKDNLYIPNIEKSTLTYLAMKKNCEKRGVRVYNATRGGKLEVFPRIDFEMIWM